MVVDTVVDLTKKMNNVKYEKEKAKKPDLLAQFKKEGLPLSLSGLEKLLVAGGGKYFAGNTLTWADIAVANIIMNIQVGGLRAKGWH